MARVCVNSCGLKVDDSGRLGVNTSGTWGYACDDSNGQPIFCDSDGALRLAKPEKFHSRLIQYSAALTGSPLSATFGSPTEGGPTVHFGSVGANTVLQYAFTNPSPCVAATVVIRLGVHHGIYTAQEAGQNQVIYGSTLTNNVDASTSDAHVAWNVDFLGAGQRVDYDTMNNTVVVQRTVAPGASITFTATPYIQVEHDNGNATITSFITVLDVEAFTQP